MSVQQNHFKACIKQLWSHLTEEEIAAHEEMRDVFFMAVRRKHGVARSEAESILERIISGLEYGQCENAA